MKEKAQKMIEQFKKHARAASYHYADDTGKEWDLAKKEKNIALEIFDNNPDLQEELREIARNDELWSIDTERPTYP